jgi:hypothetical protein
MDIGGSFGNYYYYYCNPCTDMNVTITQYGPVGTQIVGSYYGKLKDQAGSTDVDVHGEFSVERTH